MTHEINNNAVDNDISFNKIEGKRGCLGVITLHRAKAHNALSLAMCIAIYQQLLCWQVDDDIKAVWLESSIDKVFCSGGDIKQLYLNKDSLEESLRFFQYEYALNELIFHYPKPFISMWNGIAMGGGLGISQHGHFRLATKKLIWAMPEVSIGFFPDIGAGYFFSRLQNHMGLYLGLTGHRVGFEDALELGLATHTVAENDMASIKQALVDCDWTDNGAESVTDVLASFQRKPATGLLQQHATAIEKCFSYDSIEQCLTILKQTNELQPWGQEVAGHIRSQCLLSIAITFQHIKRSTHFTFLQVMQQDRRICRYFLDQPCLYEGVRAAMIDKDRNPQWPDYSLLSDTYSNFKDLFRW